jgi:beta-galactosidase/beta-glucuronidase
MNLNGEWQFEIDCGNSGKARKFFERTALNDKIIVPFAPESKLSGIEHIDFMKSIWYKRSFSAPDNWKDGRILLHFGAVDYFTEVWVNGKSVGTHKGGYTPFTFDITDYLKNGENDLTVNAYDDVTNPLQPTGKQSGEYNNYGCLYTRSTGIWQTVWLEYTPSIYIQKLKLTPDVDNGCLHVLARFNNSGTEKIKLTARLKGEVAGFTEAKVTGKFVDCILPIEKLDLWFPETPTLYDLEIEAGKDKVSSYFGMRKIAVKGYAIEINDRPIFQRLVLDQGYYPDGIYTAPTDEDLKKDIELSQAVGFNGARMHMKVFEPRYSYWADKLGYLIWGEYPNWGLNETDPAALFAMLPEWMEAVERDYNSPAIIGWCPFNETGPNRQKDTFKTVYNVTRAYDPMRPIIDTSGYVHAVTDIYDVHDYDQNPETFKKRYEPLISGEGEIFRNFKNEETYEGQPYLSPAAAAMARGAANTDQHNSSTTTCAPAGAPDLASI